MPLKETLDRAANEVENNRLWRARDILCSSVQTYGYVPELFRSIGDMMLQMGDEPQAGKYYLLSVSDPTETELKAMDCFLLQYRKSDHHHLISLFPRQARFSKLEQYPTYLQNHLRKLGADEELNNNFKPKPELTGSIGITCVILATVAFFAVFGFITAILLLFGLF